MDKYVITAIVLCFSIKTILTEVNLQQQSRNQEQLNPVNDHENTSKSVKDQDKRTIFNPDLVNYGWAKHVGYDPSRVKYVLGFSPVDLKYSPVIRPISIKPYGYAYDRLRQHIHVKIPKHIKLPRPVYHAKWKPARPITRPPPTLQFITKPFAASKPVHIDHSYVNHVHEMPIQHVDHIHQILVPHVKHIHKNPEHLIPTHHTDHLHNEVQPVSIQHVHFQPVHQVSVQPVPQSLPSSPLFEVTKPDLGVLSLGAIFPSGLRNISPAPAALPIPLKSTLIPQPVAPAAVPLSQSAPLPILTPAVIPQSGYTPGAFVEYNSNTNLINLPKEQVPVLSQTPISMVQPELSHHFHLQHQNIHPQSQNFLFQNEHDFQTPFVPANHPHIFEPSNQPQFQQLPVSAAIHFHSDDDIKSNIYQQQLPINSQSEFQGNQDNQHFIQQFSQEDATTHFQPADQVNTRHFFHQSRNTQQGQFQPTEQTDKENIGYIYRQPNISNLRQSIQPGKTDLQLPIHLPHHRFMQSTVHDNFQDPQYSESVFRPSIQLEPPYKK